MIENNAIFLQDKSTIGVEAETGVAIVIVGVMRVVACLIGALLVARVRSRRRLLQLSTMIMTAAMLALAVTSYIQEQVCMQIIRGRAQKSRGAF